MRTRQIRLHGLSESTVDRFGRSGAPYAATEARSGFERTPTSLLQVEHGWLRCSHTIAGMNDLDRRNQAAFGGGFAACRDLAVVLTRNDPLSVTLDMASTARLIDDTGAPNLLSGGEVWYPLS